MLNLIHIALDISAVLFSLTTAIEAMLVFCRQRKAIILVFGISGICVALLTLISRFFDTFTNRSHPHRLPIYINALASTFYLATGIAFILELVQGEIDVDSSYAAFHFVIPIIFIFEVAIISASITARLGELAQLIPPRLDEESTDTKVDFDGCLPPSSSRQSLAEKMSRKNSYPPESVLPDASESRLLKMASEKTLIDQSRQPQSDTANFSSESGDVGQSRQIQNGSRHLSDGSGDIDQLVDEYLNSHTSITDIGGTDSNWMDSGARLHSLNNGVNPYALLRAGSSTDTPQSPSPVSDVVVKSRAPIIRRPSSRSLIHKANPYRNSPKRHRTKSDASSGLEKIAHSLRISTNDQVENRPLEIEKKGLIPSRCIEEPSNAARSLQSQSEYCEIECSFQPTPSLNSPRSDTSPQFAYDDSNVIVSPPVISNLEKHNDAASRLSTVGEIDTSADYKKKSSTALLVCTKELRTSPIDEQTDIANEYFASCTVPHLPLHPELDNFSHLSDRLCLVDYFRDFNDVYLPGNRAGTYEQSFKLPAIQSDFRHDRLPSESSNEYRLVLDGLESISMPSQLPKNDWSQPDAKISLRDNNHQWLDNDGIGRNNEPSRGVRIHSGGDVFVYDRAQLGVAPYDATTSIQDRVKFDAPNKEDHWMFTESSTMIFKPESENSFAESVNYKEPHIARSGSHTPSGKASFETLIPDPQTPTHNSFYDFVTPEASLRRGSKSPIRALFRSSPRKVTESVKNNTSIFDVSSQSCPSSAKRSPSKRVRHSSSQVSLASTISQYTGGSPKKAIRAALGNRGNHHKKSLSMPTIPPPMFPVTNAGKFQSALERRKTTAALRTQAAEFKLSTDPLELSEGDEVMPPLERVNSVPGLIIGEYDREKWETLKALRNNQNGEDRY